jgi:hypothetical protein
MVLFQELIAASKAARKRVPVRIPSWESVLNGKQLYVEQMSVEDRDAWEADGLEKDGDQYKPRLYNMRARLIYRCLVDEEGNKVFPNADTVKELPAVDAVPIYEQALELNRISNKDVEDIAKNSESGQSAASG